MNEFNLQQEIEKIEKDLAAKKAALEQQMTRDGTNELPPEKEILHEMIRERIASPQPIIPSPPPTQSEPPLTAKPGDDTPAYLLKELNNPVKKLIDTAFSKSIDHAIKEARGTGNSALVDAFHDALVDELYENLLEYRRLKKI